MSVIAGSGGLFLDRDGTINIERDYLSNPGDLELIPGAAEAIREANILGLKVFVISNQSGVARGLYSERDVLAVHTRLAQVLKDHGARVDAMYYCPHHPDYGNPAYRKVCSCRKPNTGMLLQAQKEHGIDLAASFVVGDKYTDLQAGWNAGTKAILVLTGYGKTEYETYRSMREPDHVAKDLPDAWKYIREAHVHR